MIYFLTQKIGEYQNLGANITVTNDDNLCKNVLKGMSFMGYDKETTHLNPFIAKQLLDSLGDEHNQVVIDRTTKSPAFLQEILSERLVYGHNIKYDFTVSKANGLEFRNVYCTMLAEQRLGMGTGRENTLEATYTRRLNKKFPVRKDTRLEFINWQENKLFQAHHIIYSANDVAILPEIVKAQAPIIKERQIERLLEIEFSLCPILGDMELEGIYLNEDAWKELIKDNERDKQKFELELDSIMNQLKGMYPSLHKMTFNRMFNTQVGLFGEDKQIASSSINYSSSAQVIEIFKVMGLPLPQKHAKNQITHKKEWKDSSGEEALNSYLIKYPHTPLRIFIKKLIEYKEVDKALNSFGNRFLVTEFKNKQGYKLGYKSTVTGRVHTSYKQCTTATGRLASGDADIGMFNSQQLPKLNKYRHCFSLSPQEIKDGWKICTMDLSGAEVIIAASLSGEHKVLAYKDIHSELATPAYRKVLTYIKKTYSNEKQQIQEALLLLSNTKFEATESLAIQALSDIEAFTITKEDSHLSESRDDFKKVVYGLFYGGTASRISEVLNVPLKYGEIIETALKEELPILFKYLDDNAHQAKKEGQLKFNNRTNSYHIFKSYLAAHEWNRGLSFAEAGEIERAAKNYPIQGTQADMVKEAIGVIWQYVQLNKIEFKFLMQVHDEIVFMYKEDGVDEIVAKLLTDTCNLYLTKGVTMKCTKHSGLTWHK